MPGNAILVNFAGGETSPKSRGRFDIQSYTSSCRKLVNFIAEVSGPARFRPGFRHLAETRGSNAARLIPFQLNDSQAYMLEFTTGYTFTYTLGVVTSSTPAGRMRVFKDGVRQTRLVMNVLHVGYNATGGLQIQVSGDVTGALAAGATIVLSGVGGAVDLNGQDWYVSTVVGYSGITLRTTFDLARGDTGAEIPYAADFETTGPTATIIYEVATPYLPGDLDFLQYAQTPDTMYLAHYAHAPRKLTVDSSGTWTLATYARTNDPFVAGAALTINAITLDANGVYVGFALPATIYGGQGYTIAAVVGSTQLNGNTYLLEPDPMPPFGTAKAYLLDATTGARISSAGIDAYVSGGTATPVPDNPISVAFYESRLFFAGTNRRPRTIFASRSPVPTTGATRYDDFTGGTDADHACFFSLAPVAGSVDYISWAGGTSKYLLVGTFGGTFRVSGGGLDEPITPSSINNKQLDAFGCAAYAPALNGNQAYFTQRGGITLRGVRFDADVDDFATHDLCLNADQIGYSELKRVVLQTNRPDLLWAIREDGVLCSMTVQGGERIAGWHRHKIGGTAAKVLDVAVLPRPGADDQLYVVTERTVNGATRRSVEVMADDVVYPDPEDFYTAEADGAANAERYMDAVYRLQERYIHIDAAAAYNGAAAGVAAGATMTPSAATVGAGRTFTASAAVFTAADIGKEIWKKPSAETGVGEGRATITAFTSSTVVTAEVTVAFDSAAAIPAGDWYLAADAISGLWHLEGQRVAVVADGAVYSDGKTAEYPTITVASGAIALTRNCAVVHVGLPYEGMLITHNLEMGGQTGPAQDKPRNLARMAIRFLNSLGCEFGTSLYRTEKIVHNSNKYKSDRPTPVFSGVKIVHNSDDWLPENREKNVVVVQKLPLPSVVQFIDVHYDVGDE